MDELLSQSGTFLWWWSKVPAIFFSFAFGACVGSFLNVVVYRLPSGMSIISPPSRCPTCGARLRWRDNLPILGWLLLRGKCRYCEDRVSPQYFLVEVFTALFFTVLTILFYLISPHTPYWGEVASAWWYWNGIATLPAYIAYLVMFSGLIAMTLIDARTFTIPIQIPIVVTLVAFVAYPIQALMPTRAVGDATWPVPLADWTMVLIATGGVAGLGISIWLLYRGVFRYSFDDYEEYVKGDEILADYPHARREMWVELLFLLPCLSLMLVGYVLGRYATGEAMPPLVISAFGASVFGYIVGGGIVWAVRILGTLAFGREALGIGDVHLLAAVGAVVGWRDPVFIFFGAAFVGLGWVFVTMVLSVFSKRIQRELPYGPHLAVATFLVLLLHPILYPDFWETIERAMVQLATGR